MPRGKGREGKEFQALKDSGLKLRSLQDEYSYQPDSGGAIGGTRGEQEYGIRSDYDAAGGFEQRLYDVRRIEDPTSIIPGESQWSQEQRLPDEERSERSPEDVVRDRDPMKVAPGEETRRRRSGKAA